MFRQYTMHLTILLFPLYLSACQSGSETIFHTPEKVHFNQATQRDTGPTRVTWTDRELAFYPLPPEGADPAGFMVVDTMKDRSIEYILRGNQLVETRFSLPDGSLVRFDLSGLNEGNSAILVFHCTAHSNAFYEQGSIPDNLARSISDYYSRFSKWNNSQSGILHGDQNSDIVLVKQILKSICCGVELL